MRDQETFLNKPDVQASLGVGPPDRPYVKFQTCNVQVLYAHRVQGGNVRDTVHLVPELIRAGIRVLAYAGNADAAVNYMGVESFVEHLGSAFREEFGQAERRMWVVGNRTAGYVRAWGGDGGTAGNLTFVAVYEAG
jgi:cathepsin A (carboxypeptidase C)